MGSGTPPLGTVAMAGLQRETLREKNVSLSLCFVNRVKGRWTKMLASLTTVPTYLRFLA